MREDQHEARPGMPAWHLTWSPHRARKGSAGVCQPDRFQSLFSKLAVAGYKSKTFQPEGRRVGAPRSTSGASGTSDARGFI